MLGHRQDVIHHLAGVLKNKSVELLKNIAIHLAAPFVSHGDLKGALMLPVQISSVRSTCPVKPKAAAIDARSMFFTLFLVLEAAAAVSLVQCVPV